MRLAAAGSQAEWKVCERQMAVTGGDIDKLVYELYGLTVDEIKIVESG